MIVAWYLFHLIMDGEMVSTGLRNQRTRMVILAVAFIALAGGLSFSLRSRTSKRDDRTPVQMDIPREPAGPEVRALFAPLSEGSEVEGWRIRTIEGVRDGVIHVVLVRGVDAVEVLVALRQGTTVTSPATVGPYALFNMGLARLDGQALRIIRALADRIRANVSVPVPPGLEPFRPNGG